MSKGGHLLTALALSYAVYERSASPTLAAGTLLGASFPDVGEMVQFLGRCRLSLIPHRTITHWIPFYVLAIFALPIVAPWLPWWVLNLARGVCFGSILHIILDAFSPAGIPCWSPFGARVSIGPRRPGEKPYLYRTGTAEELPVIMLSVVAIVGLLAPHPAPLSLHAFTAQSLDVLASIFRGLR